MSETRDPLREAYIRKLEADNDELRERIIQLEDELKGGGISLTLPLEWQLTGKEYAVVETLMRLPVATKDQILTSVYSLMADEEPEIKIIDVFICKARKKLKPFGINIETVWGRGYMFSSITKDKIRAYMAQRSAA